MFDTNENQSSIMQRFSLQFVLNAIFKRKKIIIGFLVIVVGITTVANFFAPHQYLSKSNLHFTRTVDVEQQMFLNIIDRSSSASDYSWINAEVAIMKSYPVAERVVHKLKLYPEPEEGADPNVPVDLTTAISKFSEGISVSNNVDNDLVSISYTSEDPHIAAAVVNAVIEAYIQHRSELYDESDQYKFIENQLQSYDDEIESLEQQKTEFKQREGIISAEAQETVLLARLQGYESKVTDLRTSRISLQVKLDELKRQLASGEILAIPSIGSGNSDTQVADVRTLISTLRTQESALDVLKQRFTPEYDEVKKQEQVIATTKQRIRSGIEQIVNIEETAMRALQREEEEFQKLANRTRGEIRDLVDKNSQLSKLDNRVADSRGIRNELLKQKEEARISLEKLDSDINIKVINPALVPTEPIGPNKRGNVMMSVVLGLIGAVGLALAIEFFDSSIDSADQLETLGGLTVLGSVRDIEDDGGEGPSHGGKRRNAL